MKKTAVSALLVFVLFLQTAHAGELHEAAWNNDLAGVKVLLRKGANVNEADGGGYFPLQIAAAKGNLSMVRLMLADGAKVDVNSPLFESSAGYTPFYFAVSNGHKDVAELLLQRGANINATTARGLMGGDTALHAAVEKNDTEMVKWLLEKGIDANIRNNIGNSALDKLKDNEAIREILVSRGARSGRVEQSRRGIGLLVVALFFVMLSYAGGAYAVTDAIKRGRKMKWLLVRRILWLLLGAFFVMMCTGLPYPAFGTFVFMLLMFARGAQMLLWWKAAGTDKAPEYLVGINRARLLYGGIACLAVPIGIFVLLRDVIL